MRGRLTSSPGAPGFPPDDSGLQPAGPEPVAGAATPAAADVPRREPSPSRADRTDANGSRPPLAELKRAWKIEEVIQASGVTLTRAGEDRLVGHCPFHEDSTPSFSVYLFTQRFHCYGRCHGHGDVLDFVQQVRGCSLAQAIQWLESTWPTGRLSAAPAREGRGPTGSPAAMPDPGGLSPGGRPRLAPPDEIPAPEPRNQQAAPQLSEPPAVAAASIAPARGAQAAPSASALGAEVAWNEESNRLLALTLATAFYAQALPSHRDVVAYLQRRGISLHLARQHRLGYADGHALADYFAPEPSLRQAAQRCGLLSRSGAERFAGRLVVPEVRAGRTVWMIGRSVPPVGGAVASASSASPGERASGSADAQSAARGRRRPPKYLGLTTPRHFLLGYGLASATIARGHRTSRASQERPLVPAILVVEGALDYIVAQSWRLPVPCVALLGTHPSPGQVAELVGLRRQALGAPLVLALDSDEAGRHATQELARALAGLGLGVVILPALPGAKDLGELGPRPDGRACLLQVLDQVLSHAASTAFDPAPRAPLDAGAPPPGPDRHARSSSPSIATVAAAAADRWNEARGGVKGGETS